MTLWLTDDQCCRLQHLSADNAAAGCPMRALMYRLRLALFGPHGGTPGRMALILSVMLLGCQADGTVDVSPDWQPLSYAYGEGTPGTADTECQLTDDTAGLMGWLCLQSLAPQSPMLPADAHRNLVMVKVVTQDECPTTGEPNWTTYGCWDSGSFNDPQSRIVIHAHSIGPNSVCPHGTPMEFYTPACRRQFYAVFAHELEHDVFGPAHGHSKSLGGWVIYGGFE